MKREEFQRLLENPVLNENGCNVKRQACRYTKVIDRYKDIHIFSLSWRQAGHQIRVHMAYICHPPVIVYGNRKLMNTEGRPYMPVI